MLRSEHATLRRNAADLVTANSPAETGLEGLPDSSSRPASSAGSHKQTDIRGDLFHPIFTPHWPPLAR
jgi:hypothetical protein